MVRRPPQRGGSETFDALFSDSGLDCSGIAITFVAERRSHDTIHEKRSRGPPSTNCEDLVVVGSPIARAHPLEGETLLLAARPSATQRAARPPANEPAHHDRSFDMQTDPNRTHGISAGAGTRRRLHTTMTGHVLEHLPAGAR